MNKYILVINFRLLQLSYNIFNKQVNILDPPFGVLYVIPQYVLPRIE